MSIINIIYSILIILMGMGIIKYRKTVKSWIGNLYWAEHYLGRGGTYFIIILSGIGAIFYGVYYLFK